MADDHEERDEPGWNRVDVVEVDGPVAVIGDIHGRADLLRLLLRRLGDMPVFVVGDVCDRGPDTRDVIDQLIARGARGVRGNHEDWLCQLTDGRGFDTMALSTGFGGAATLASYGIEGRSPREVEAQARSIPKPHRDWLASLPVALRLIVDNQVFWVVHAGVSLHHGASVDPVAMMDLLARDEATDLLWHGLDPDEIDELDGPVIHGHTPHKAPIDAGHAIAIDTGCGIFPDGRLTAVVLPARRFVSVADDDLPPAG
jgi:serine/threonine protein phosphatase 1